VSLTLGKSSNEIYYAAIRPHERRRIKPALDTLIERWSDAVVGCVLLVVMRLLQIPIGVIVGVTAVAAAIWLFVLYHLDRQYGRAFREALSRRAFDPGDAPESLRVPAARRAILEALASGEEPRVLAALRFCPPARHPALARAVRDRLGDPSPAVQAAAITAMAGMGQRDPDGVIERLTRSPDERVRRAAVRHVIPLAAGGRDFARRVLDDPDDPLRADVESLADHPAVAEGLFDRARLDAWLASGRREDLLLAARALGAIDAPFAAAALRELLERSDTDVRRAALAAAARRPRPESLDALLPLLAAPGLGHDARRAVVPFGDRAVPALERLIAETGGARAPAQAAEALARIATPRARRALMALVRSADVRLRHLGLGGLARIRLETGRPVLPRRLVHRMFLREMRDYRACAQPASALAGHAVPELRLFGESWRESAGRAIERGVQALACWYDPRPLFGVLDRLRPDTSGDAAPALEHLARILPRRVFQPVSRVLEQEAPAVSGEEQDRERLAGWIRAAWENGDAWLRAVAVRASRCVPGFDRRLFEPAGSTAGRDPSAREDRARDPLVRAELAALDAAPAIAAAGARC
jgi:HEAT repeat protein